MISILSWNIQNGLGCDGELSLTRIASVIKSMGSADILCLQEVSVNMALPDGSRDHQVNSLRKLFPDHQAFFGAAIDVPSTRAGVREQFGNLILSSLPVHTVFCHPLPQPPHASIKQMPRQLIELSVKTSTQNVRIMTSHLEYHSQIQRHCQAKRILDIQDEVVKLSLAEPKYDTTGPYAKISRDPSCVVCGDFNFLPDSDEYKLFTINDSEAPLFMDAWDINHSGETHPPTCGIYDAQQWEQGAHCRDFMFISPDLANHVLDIKVNTKTNASDHQPVRLELDI